MVMRLLCMQHKLTLSNRLTSHTSAASCKARMVELWNLGPSCSPVQSCAPIAEMGGVGSKDPHSSGSARFPTRPSWHSFNEAWAWPLVHFPAYGQFLWLLLPSLPKQLFVWLSKSFLSVPSLNQNS